MKLVWDVIMSVLVGLVVASGLGWTGAGATLGLPAEVAWVVAGVAGTGYLIWRREDPTAHESPRERLERELFGP